MTKFKLFLAGVLAPAAVFCFTGSVPDMGSMYAAPENAFLYRVRFPNGAYREFEGEFGDKCRLRGAEGWKGRRDGGRIAVRSADGKASFVFRDGRLVKYAVGGETGTVSYAETRVPAGGPDSPPYYFSDAAGSKPAAARKAVSGKWRKSGRLRWPFENPNENGFLFAALALLSLFAACRRARAWKACGTTFSALFAAATVLTASRGAMLALALGVLPVFALNFKSVLRSKAFWISAVALAALAAWFAPRSRMLSRGFGRNSWSNEARLEMWRAAPAMMADAPDGWKDYNAGRAYMDWYQPTDELSLPGSLMNDHLTRMAARSWPRRFDYVFCWAFAFMFLGWLAFRTKRAEAALALGSWTLAFAAGWFNPVTGSWWAFLPASAATALAVPALLPLPRRKALAAAVVSMACAVGAAGALTLSVYAAGRGGNCLVKVRSDGRAVTVNGERPSVWVVDDGRALGGALACKDVRAWFLRRPSSPAVGYARDVSDLPRYRIRRLVLAGRAGTEWMDSVRKLVESGSGFGFVPPREVVFVSPEFPPSALPPEFVEMCRARIVVGEFAAAYEPEYADPPPWAKVVPGMELYIEDWMKYAAEGI